MSSKVGFSTEGLFCTPFTLEANCVHLCGTLLFLSGCVEITENLNKNTVLWRIHDAFSLWDTMTSFQGVVQHKQIWFDLSKLQQYDWFSVKESESELCSP